MQDRKNKRDRIGYVLYVFYILLLMLSILLVVKILCIQFFFSPDRKLAKVLTPTNVSRTIDPERGNIIDCNGRLLAMSCPTYQIAMDCTVAANDDEAWEAKARQLAVKLSAEFGDKTAEQYFRMMRDGREKGKKYLKIGRSVDRNAYNRIKEFPLFNEGRFKGGLLVEQDIVRTYPYGKLARRTIGFVRNNKSDVGNTHIGLEGRFDYVLHGTNGKEWLRVTDYGRVRNNDSTSIKAIDGKDIRTTLNIDYQDVADRALREQITEEEDLEGATLVLMEVSTGAVRAMVNLYKDQGSSSFEEVTNMAVGRCGEPGSVFKTVTLMSVLNDGFITSLEQKIPTNHGRISGTAIPQDQHICDYERTNRTSEISILEGFKMSSNYVFGKLAVDCYRDNKAKFVEDIHSYKLGEAFDFDLEGLATPVIHSASKLSLTDLGVMGYGYTTGETPLHILTFYNAIAAKGRMMKPYLVESIEKDGKVCQKRGPSVLNSAICSRAVADTLTRALKAVTEDGTARRLKNAKCSVAGKTGTAFILFPNGTRQDQFGRHRYQGTFVGFFPAENPLYSIICTVYSKPTSHQFQGGGIPAKAVKTVVDAMYSMDPGFRNRIEKTK